VTDAPTPWPPEPPPPGRRSSLVRLVAWEGPPGSPGRFDPRSRYAERFWVPVVGSTAGWVLRRFADALDAEPDLCRLDLADLAAGLGLNWSGSGHSPVGRAVSRCVRYETARWSADGVLGVRLRLPVIPKRLLLRLPFSLQVEHRDWDAGLGAVEGSGPDRRRARVVALDLAGLDVDDACIERHLLRRGVHPAAAFDAVRWARSSEVERLLSG
jgi:hypothetical protein